MFVSWGGFNWFLIDKKVKLIASNITDDKISGQFQVLDGNVALTSNPNIELYLNNKLQNTIITTSFSNDIFSFDYDIPFDGDYAIKVTNGEDFALWKKKIDTTGPAMEIVGGFENNYNV